MTENFSCLLTYLKLYMWRMTEEEKEFVVVRVLGVGMIQLLQGSENSLLVFDYEHNDAKSWDLTLATISSSSITVFLKIALGVVRSPQSSETHYIDRDARYLRTSGTFWSPRAGRSGFRYLPKCLRYWALYGEVATMSSISRPLIHTHIHQVTPAFPSHFEQLLRIDWRISLNCKRQEC